LAGDLLGLEDKIQPLVQQKEGEVFSSDKTSGTVKAITEYLGGLGYAFANANPNPVLDRENHTADLTFYVDPGRRVYVRRIEIGGNVRTRDEVVRREMRQQEAAWYDSDAIKFSRDRVDRLGYFNEVDVNTKPVPGSPDQVDVNVEVKEKPTGLVNLGIGYGSTDKLMLSAGISQDNIFGSGNSLSLQVNTSKVNRAAVISHTNPFWTGDGISKTTSIYYRRTTPYQSNDGWGDYQNTAIGAGLNFGVPISEYDRVFMGVNFEHNKLSRLSPQYTPRDDRCDFHTVLALGQVLLFQLEFRPFQHGTVKNPAFSKAYLGQGVDNILGVELTHAIKGHGGDGRALFDIDDQHVGAGVNLHVAEKAGGVQALNRICSLLFREGLTDLDRQRREHGAGIDPLDAVDLNIAHDKRCKCIRQGGSKQTCHQYGQNTQRKSRFPAKRHPGQSLVGQMVGNCMPPALN
jgi:hypothetical protein